VVFRGGCLLMRWDGTKEPREMNGRDKQALVEGLTKLSAALEADHTPGAPLPTGLYWDLRYKARDGLKFLRRRRNGTT